METTTAIIYAFSALAVLFVIFLIMRELNCWYFKINKLIELKEKEIKLQREIALKLGVDDVKIVNILTPKSDKYL